MAQLQDVIHRIEVARGPRYFKWALAVLAAVLLAVVWDLNCYRNLATREAMDAAQLGRNLAEGRGYTTLFVRPFSQFLLSRHSRETSISIRETQPDISNPPVYPVVLAGLMKVLPFKFDIPPERQKQKAFWSHNGRFWRYQPDFLIAVFNQVLFLAAVGLVYFWARRLFDGAVAALSALVLLGTELLWRFSVSGLSTMLLLVIFMGVVWCLTLLEEAADNPGRKPAALWALTIAAGLLIGLGGLTRYAFAWLIVPVLIFLALSNDARRPVFCLLVLAAFAVVMAPWAARNMHLTGAPFGTATYSVMEGTDHFPQDRLERSLNPNAGFLLQPIRDKLFTNLRQIVQKDIFSVAGSVVTAFFLVGLMVGFRNRATRRLRHFLLLSLGVLVIAQALGRTQLSQDSPEINSENLLALLVPLVVVYAMSLFVLLLDQVALAGRGARFALMSSFVVICSSPMIFALLPPRPGPVVYPPYHPQVIQETAALLNESEWIMSDVPWAVAWYGRRPCLWLTLNTGADPNDIRTEESFAAVHNHPRPISAVYLTPKTTGSGLVAASDTRDGGWSALFKSFADAVSNHLPPPDFPLQQVLESLLPEQLVLCDRKRW